MQRSWRWQLRRKPRRRRLRPRRHLQRDLLSKRQQRKLRKAIVASAQHSKKRGEDHVQSLLHSAEHPFGLLRRLRNCHLSQPVGAFGQPINGSEVIRSTPSHVDGGNARANVRGNCEVGTHTINELEALKASNATRLSAGRECALEKHPGFGYGPLLPSSTPDQ